MKGRNVIIKLHQNRVWFNDIVSLPVADTNLPADLINFSKIQQTFWLIEQVTYDQETGELEARITNYFLRDIAAFEEQNPKKEILSVIFTNLSDPDNLRRALKYYSKDMGQLDRAMEEGYRELREK